MVSFICCKKKKDVFQHSFRGFCYLVLQGGNYVLTLMDVYGGGIAVLFIAIAECISLLWIYGKGLCLDFEEISQLCFKYVYITDDRNRIYKIFQSHNLLEISVTIGLFSWYVMCYRPLHRCIVLISYD
jgi:hypothetical protein